ncbi:DUF3999 family protein [Williamwhitmania taraxaci]|uniref:F5/8 type C domain-containing protein n=1 Tax=Williamwhitmania taraxaci TaxID=1640674 RepID=A0A1G6H3G6_9BACT|nr:DUF3999 family protein [Williamwhitmania taraxaci]SDB88819.1 Protein of unknown function [Williamwhitmania taraxaci]
MIQTRSLWAILLSICCCTTAFGQTSSNYRYHRPITGITETWHKLTLPNELIGKLSPDYSDLRIFGISNNHDTVEAPYILRQAQERSLQQEIPFKIINRAHTELASFFTFEVPKKEAINSIRLVFEEQNFDWRLNLQGSQDNQTWYTLAEDYRILSINNSHTQYKFTEVEFPDAKYRYLRVELLVKDRPKLVSANLLHTETIKGNYESYGVFKPNVTNNLKAKQTIASVNLSGLVPISHVKLWIREKFDYYRPITIAYISDSVTTEMGNVYSYETLYSGTLTSLEKRSFECDNAVAKRIAITIDNYDNQPLTIDSVEVCGTVYELIARFTQTADYTLAYGNKNVNTPTYDIEQFTDKIPTEMKSLKLGVEEERGVVTETTLPLFQNKLWLWLVIGAIVVIMGYFTLRMMKQE